MNLVIIGTGYVGLVSGVCFSGLGNIVTCVDINEKKIDMLQRGRIPFYEPGLKDLVMRNVQEGRIFFATSLKSAMKDVDCIFIAVGTPPSEDGSADLKYVYQVAKEIGQSLDHFAVVVDKSTVPVGTARNVREIIGKYYNGDFAVVSNPEFLREGSAVKDFKNPDRIVVGTDHSVARVMMEKLYKDFSCQKIFTNLESAEMIKYASNAFLATKISFINEIANVCETVGADVKMVAMGMGLDSRIGEKFLSAGIGYGGSCFPKDVRALDKVAFGNNYHFHLLKAVIEVNNRQREIFIDKMKKRIGNLTNKTIGVWGLAFKPNTDDIRESAAVDIAKRLIELGAEVQAYDPKAMQEVARSCPKIAFTADMYDAATNADALAVLTEWDQFKNPDFAKLSGIMKDKIIFDGRNIYTKEEMKENGFEYVCVGR